jgi:type IV pilus assembly protein PilB
MDILNLAIKKGLISPDNEEKIRDESLKRGLSLEDALLNQNVSASDILSLKSEYFSVPTREVDTADITDAILNFVPQETAEHYHFVPIGVSDNVLEIGMTSTNNIEAIDALNFIASKIQMPFKIFLISEGDFTKVFALYKGLTGEVSKALNELDTELKNETVVKKEKEDKDVVNKNSTIGDDAPVTKIVATILRYASDGNASDIHIEPWREVVKVRFRVDGVMNTSLVLPLKVHSAVVARIKILCNMRLDEKR